MLIWKVKWIIFFLYYFFIDFGTSQKGNHINSKNQFFTMKRIFSYLFVDNISVTVIINKIKKKHV